MFARRRGEGGVFRGSVMDWSKTPESLKPENLYAAVSFDAVNRVFRDSRVFNSQIYDSTIGLFIGPTILAMEGKPHWAHRNLVSAAFKTRSLARWEPEIVRPVVDGLIDEFVDAGEADLVREFTFEFPRDDYRIPGAEYEVCESERDGWLPHTPTCQTVRLPEWPGACVQLNDFVNQQVGHSESQDHGKGEHGGKGGPDYGKGGPSHGGDIKCTTYHEVKAGEGLYDIGASYKKSPQQMLDANPDVRNGNELWVYVGQRICIP